MTKLIMNFDDELLFFKIEYNLEQANILENASTQILFWHQNYFNNIINSLYNFKIIIKY